MPTAPLPPQRWLAALTLLGFAGLLGVLAWKLHELQVERRDRLIERAAAQRERTWVLPSQRGAILDANGAPLVVSVGTWTVKADPDWMDDRLRATVELSRILGIDRAKLRAHFESGRNGRILAEGIRDAEPGDDDPIDAVRRLKLAGVGIARDFTRTYQERALAPHVLGFVQRDGGGGMGIEQVFDRELTGQDGSERVMVDALGKPVLDSSQRKEPVHGANVQLTIDLAIQRILQEQLAAGAEKFAPRSGCGIVVRPATGEIVAMASWPDFDPADRSGLTPERMRNNVLNFVYEPGSTMKPLVTGAAVADGMVRFTDRIDCENGAWTFRPTPTSRGRTVRELTGGHGVLSVIEGIALSDNIMMAKLGTRMGPGRLKEWIVEFGFGRETGIALPGEDVGIMPASREWSLLGACMSVPMGHGIAVTPLQLAMAHAAVANGGLWLPPRLVKRIWRDGEGDLPLPAQPPSRRIFAAADAFQIQDAMTYTMTEGTGKRVQLDGYTSAGKTGTAAKLIGGQYSSNINDTSFVCWAPAEAGVRPELLCLVVFEAPDPARGHRFGGDTAAPVVREVLQAGLEYLKVPKRADPVAVAAAERGR